MKAPPQVLPPDWEDADVTAFQSLARGDCPPHLQKRALDWFIRKAAGTYDLSFAPGDPTLTAFHEGRRFAGLQVVKLLSLDRETLRKAKRATNE
jgi:hypothetical protein